MRAQLERHEAEGRSVVVVCGGYHANALKQGTRHRSGPPPDVTVSADVQVGSALVLFSFKRLDAFAGYASGMPSPAWYQCLLERGHEATPDVMLVAAVTRLRAKGQVVSVADVIAARTMMGGLALVRGRALPSRLDVLDALAGALLKDALDAPLPWSRRGTLSPRTAPLLVELLAAFSGEQVGALAEGTPLPPLVADVTTVLSRVGLSLERLEARATCDVSAEGGRRRSQVLHRLRLIGVAGVVLRRSVNFSRRHTSLKEEWSLQRSLETDSSLIEASRFGGTLEAAASFALEERLDQASGVAALAAALVAAAHAGLRSLEQRWLAIIAQRISTEPMVGEASKALDALLHLRHGEAVVGERGAVGLEEVLRALVARVAWLLEGVTGATAAYDRALVGAFVSLKHASVEAGLVDDAAVSAMALRLAQSSNGPPCLRGAALGYVWTAKGASLPEDEVVALVRGAAHPSSFGDFLAGLFAVAQRAAPSVLVAIDRAVAGMTRDDFFVALPALRLAFSFFAPNERLHVAETLLSSVGESTVDPMQLLQPTIAPSTVQAGQRADQAAFARAKKFGLLTGEPHAR